MIRNCETCRQRFEARTAKQRFCHLLCYCNRKGTRRLVNQTKTGKHDRAYRGIPPVAFKRLGSEPRFC